MPLCVSWSKTTSPFGTLWRGLRHTCLGLGRGFGVGVGLRLGLPFTPLSQTCIHKGWSERVPFLSVFFFSTGLLLEFQIPFCCFALLTRLLGSLLKRERGGIE